MAENLEHVPSDDGNSFLEDELEALSSIYINETNVYKNDDTTTVSIDLHPATADNLQEQYVKLTLKLTVKDEYPDVIPEIDIRNPRGLSDEKLSSIIKELLKIAEEKRGSSMLFEIIEAAKDYLTAGNRPCEECAICLYGFHEDDVFTKTECYHYFHSSCLARYAKNCSTSDDNSKSDDSLTNELLCPVCRLPINFEGVDDSYPSPVKGDDDYSVTETILQTQKKLQELYIRQVEKGGIIDLEAEKNKYLIEISHVPSALDVASGARSEEEINLKICQEKDNNIPTSPSENVQNDNPDSQEFCLNRSSNSERPNRKYIRNREERIGNDGPRPHHSNDYRRERYQSSRGGNGYRKDSRGGRNNYERRYDSYNNDYGERYNGINRNRFSNPRRNNWHENQHKSNQYERHEKYDERNSQRYERNDKYDERNSQRYERNDKYDERNSQRYERNDKYDERNSQRYESSSKHDSSSQRYNTRDERRKPDTEDDALCRDDAEDRSQEIDQKSDSEENNIQDSHMDKVSDEKRNAKYDGDRRNASYNEGRRNNHYDGRRENKYERRNDRYDYNRRYTRYEDSRPGQYDRRNNRFDSRKYNEPNVPRRNENFAPARHDRTNEGNKNRYLNQENGSKELKFRKENESGSKNISTSEKEVENSSTAQEAEQERNLTESEYTETDIASTTLTKDVDVGNASESYPSDRKRNFPIRNSDSSRQNGSRNYNRHYQRSNSNGDQYNTTNRYSKHSNYHSERRQSKPQNIRSNSDDLDRGETTNPLNSNDIAKDDCESNKSNLEHNQITNNEESGDLSYDQHSRKNSVRNDAGSNHYKNYRDGKQRNSNRFPNRNYHETRPYKNDPRPRNYQNDYSDRTSNGSKRYVPQKSANDSSHNIPLTENETDAKHEPVPKESEPVPVKTSSKTPTQVPPKDSELEKSVPTSNFLPPMSSVAPPPGFQNPTRKIVYGLAAANPPPGFNRS